ncbi:MAG: hypothetical protein B6241_13490 [Spirochaetaceae bacterium 4572_59]|nr:MAG: hypothetical protein B6241_13490 [Spirochaetaceae bacterium 4572_59]
MKKFLIALVLLSLTSAIFADDALVMPKGVIRVYFVGTYGITDSAYDTDGEAQDSSTGDSSFFNQGYAAELGVTDSVTAALQWVPGHNLFCKSEVDPMNLSLIANYGANPYGENKNLKTSGASDIFAGAKIQILGDHGFVKNDQFRFSMAPGFRIPLDSYDAKEEFENYKSGDDWRYSGRSNESLGIGSRFYLDYIVNENFFLNFYSEMIYNLPVDKKYTSIADSTNTTEYEVKYGTDMTFELESHYDYPLTEKSHLAFYLPVNYAMTQDVEIDGTSVDDSGSKYLQLQPEIGYFNADFKVPFEATFMYGLPLWGENATKMHTFSLKLKVYARLFK